MNEAEYEARVERARSRTEEKIRVAREKFGLGTLGRYDIDLAAGKIRFRDDQGQERISADIQVAGSWSPNSQGWLWAWDNESVPGAARAKLEAVREFGEKNDVMTLAGSFEPCDEGEAWSMAAIAADLLDAECVYRAERPKNHLFLLLFSIQKVA